VFAAKHDKYAQTLQESELFTILSIETAWRLLSPNIETVTIFFDMTGATMASLDFSSVSFLINSFQARYPECLSRCFIVNAPWIFWGK
jgi:CRAL/TRIO domain